MYLDVTCSISLIHFFSFGPMAGVPTQTIYFLYDLYDFVYQSYRIVSYIFPQGSRLTCWPSGRVWDGLSFFELRVWSTKATSRHESSRVVSQPKVLPFSRIRVGTYQADMSAADPLVKGVHWGYKQGCNFATAKCVDNDVPVSKVFCSADNQVSCSLDRKAVVTCDACRHRQSEQTRSDGDAWNVWNRDFSVTSEPFADASFVTIGQSEEIGSAYNSLPAVYSYTSSLRLGGSPEMDYCPHFAIGLSNRT